MLWAAHVGDELDEDWDLQVSCVVAAQDGKDLHVLRLIVLKTLTHAVTSEWRSDTREMKGVCVHDHWNVQRCSLPGRVRKRYMSSLERSP
jgi:hypothetical protein